MDKRYQIFVSSTYSDLYTEREHVIHGLTRVGFIAVGMEQFPASEEEQMEFIRPIINESDYYVVVVRAKYGSTSKAGKSYTQLECEYATKIGKPVLAFFYKYPEKLTIDQTDQDAKKAAKLKIFKKSLMDKKIVKFWTDKADLLEAVKDSTHDQVRIRPGVGWIRGSQAIDPAIYKELEESRKEISRLNEVVATQASTPIKFPEHLSHGSDRILIEYSLRRYINAIFEDLGSSTFETTWNSILFRVSELLYEQAPEIKISGRISHLIKSGFELEDNVYVSIDRLTIIRLRRQFEALGLITTVAIIDRNRRDYDDLDSEEILCWTFTELGRRYVSTEQAIQRSASMPSL